MAPGIVRTNVPQADVRASPTHGLRRGSARGRDTAWRSEAGARCAVRAASVAPHAGGERRTLYAGAQDGHGAGHMYRRGRVRDATPKAEMPPARPLHQWTPDGGREAPANQPMPQGTPRAVAMTTVRVYQPECAAASALVQMPSRAGHRRVVIRARGAAGHCRWSRNLGAEVHTTGSGAAPSAVDAGLREIEGLEAGRERG